MFNSAVKFFKMFFKILFLFSLIAATSNNYFKRVLLFSLFQLGIWGKANGFIHFLFTV